ncbi:MAG: ribosome maturation factor RimP [Acidobacteria bacterium]|jgi:ribosome maturation factor RimP|nr:ribosome maturation factor RimP [Acidobacteriota bacterium]
MKVEPSLREQLLSLVEGEGLQLLDVEVVGSGPKTVLRLVIDGPAGVNLDQCAFVSRQASALLDVEDPIAHHYTLEVSSPGLERKLYSEGDYHRFAGSNVKVRMRPEYREVRSASGQLLGLENGLVRLLDQSGETIELPFDHVFETRLQVDWKALTSKRKYRP